jgi:hypothetical protein
MDITPIQYTGYFYEPIKKSLDAGEERAENKESRIINKLEEKRKRVIEVYNAKGQLIEYDEHERRLDINA